MSENMRPRFDKRRAFGQHFLKDRAVARRIAETAVQGAITSGCRRILEIGPGRGAVTEPLLEALRESPSASPPELLLAERDRELVSLWRERGLKVEEGDFVALPEERWLTISPLAIASNLPYSAGTAIVTRLARHPGRIPIMVLMFQAEVARRLRADPGTKAWGSLSAWIQNRWEVTRLCGVPPRAFAPPPKVDSEIVVLKPLPTSRLKMKPEDELKWEQLLKIAFSHRRKMLRAGFPRSGPWREALEASGVDTSLRAEALGWNEWQRLLDATARPRNP